MKTILILEDDVIFSRSIGNWLKKKGMATEHAATLSAARKALSAREFDLVLADLRLPDGNSLVFRFLLIMTVICLLMAKPWQALCPK